MRCYIAVQSKGLWENIWSLLYCIIIQCIHLLHIITIIVIIVHMQKFVP